MIDAIIESCRSLGAVEDGPAYDACPWGVD